jgi:uncharacterized protein YqeY
MEKQMSEVIKELRKEWMNARKEKQSEDTSFLSLMVAELENIGKNNGNRATTNDEAIAHIKKAVSNTETVLKLIEDESHSNSSDEHQKMRLRKMRLERELDLITSYIPQMVHIEEVRAFLEANLTEDMNIGQAMGMLKKEFGQAVDMKQASAMVKDMIS